MLGYGRDQLSGDSTLIVASSLPAGRAHQIDPRRQLSLTTHTLAALAMALAVAAAVPLARTVLAARRAP